MFSLTMSSGGKAQKARAISLTSSRVKCPSSERHLLIKSSRRPLFMKICCVSFKSVVLISRFCFSLRNLPFWNSLMMTRIYSATIRSFWSSYTSMLIEVELLAIESDTRVSLRVVARPIMSCRTGCLSLTKWIRVLKTFSLLKIKMLGWLYLSYRPSATQYRLTTPSLLKALLVCFNRH